MKIKYNCVDTLANFEHKLNKLGYIPVVQHLSGIARIVLGKVQAIATMLFGSLAFCAKFVFNKESNAFIKIQNFEKNCFIQAHHGIANIFRGIIEAGVPILGGLGLALYDNSVGEKTFDTAYLFRRMRYPEETILMERDIKLDDLGIMMNALVFSSALNRTTNQ